MSSYGHQLDADTYEAAAQYNHRDIIIWLRSINAQCGSGTVSAAAKAGHFDLLKWLVTNNFPINEKCILADAAESGNLEMVKWIHEDVMKFTVRNLYLYGTVVRGHIHILEYFSQYPTIIDCSLDNELLYYAMHGRQITTVEWLLESGLTPTCNTAYSAAENGNLKFLRLFHDRGVALNEKTFSSAAFGGNLEVSQWLLDNNCPYDTSACTSAAEGNHLLALKWLRCNKFPWDERTFAAAMESNNREMIEWLMSEHCPVDDSFAAAIPHCDIDIIKLVVTTYHKLNIVENKYACIAASAGRLDILQWIMESKSSEEEFPWTNEKILDKSKYHLVSNVCDYAVRTGRFRILKWAHSHGCPLTIECMVNAVNYGSIKIVRWLRKHNCPWTPDIFRHSDLQRRFTNVKMVDIQCLSISSRAVESPTDV